MIEQRYPVSVSLQLDGKDILKYVFTPRIDIIPIEEIETLRAAMEAFMLYCLEQHPEKHEPRGKDFPVPE